MIGPDHIALAIPAKAEYLITARLCAASLADRAGFGIDDIEDVKTAVAEACLFLMRRGCQGELEMEFRLDGQLCVYVSAMQTAEEKKREPEDEIGLFLMEALMDQVTYEADEAQKRHMCTLLKRQRGS